jgi:hypothetical protein
MMIFHCYVSSQEGSNLDDPTEHGTGLFPVTLPELHPEASIFLSQQETNPWRNVRGFSSHV